MAARLPRLEAEDALAISHFQGKRDLLKRLQALKQADFHAVRRAIACPTLIIQRRWTTCWSPPPAPACCRRRSPAASPWKCRGADMPVTSPAPIPLIPFYATGCPLCCRSPGRPDERRDKPHGLRDAVYQARTHNGWLDKPVSDAQLQAVWDLDENGADFRQLFASAHRVRARSAGRQRENFARRSPAAICRKPCRRR